MNTGNQKNSLVVIGLLFKNLKLQVMLLALISVMTLLRKGLETISISGVEIVIDNLDKAMFAMYAVFIVATILNVLLLVWNRSETPFGDHVQNIVLSMEYTWHFRRYLKQRKNPTVLSIERPTQRTSIDDFNKIIKKSIIDYHDNYILICMETMKTAESEKIYKGVKGEIQLFLSDYFPDYIFSDAVRNNNKIWYSGTKVTR